MSLVSRSARLVFAFSLLAALIFAAALPVLVPLAYGGAYQAVVALAQILTVGVLLSVTTGTLTQAFMATGRPEIATFLQCVRLCVTVPLMLILIPKFGLTGAAYAADGASAVQFLMVLIAYPVILHRSVPRLVPTARDLRDVFGRLTRQAAVAGQ